MKSEVFVRLLIFFIGLTSGFIAARNAEWEVWKQNPPIAHNVLGDALKECLKNYGKPGL